MSRSVLRSRTRLGVLRRIAAVAVVVTVALLAYSFVGTAIGDDGRQATGERDRPLVAAIDGTGPGQIVAFGASGEVVHRNRSLWLYHDVDPSPRGSQTVTYVASGPAASRHCARDTCIENVVRRVNLTTGEGTVLHTWKGSLNGSAQFHDVDRIDESTLLVADISFPDRVFAVNTTTDEVVWEWRVSEAYEPSSGGNYPGDWTHVNDVEYLPDGRVMVSLRNQDQVVFIEPGEGLQEDWTLGADGDHGVLYEAHNPDYIPAERGGPAVLVADSENNRIVEYARRNGSWVRTWTWSDGRLQWPRDADRLPNGNTLVVDSHGERIVSVAPSGEVAWSKPFPDGGYDAELLGTGDESAGGPSATRAGLESRSRQITNPRVLAVSLVPPLVLHGALFALPAWTSAFDATVLLAAGALVTVWLVVEVAVRTRRRYRKR
ncbi:aryl-sulfate sulfotransferase [Halosimplex aquaticum]|uniref:Aryl-sulfate sulfotransferase n=1 Tax=Halosimplex aquaticum TaxID=3026162 RepID=A0ABD5Y4C1_9EURY|nr:aryl-sulfate sulfotransferase [Halosimplex aquaticum]